VTQGVYVLGLDAGGTKTVCLLADLDGQIVSQARGPGANLQAVGELEVEKSLHGVMDAALGDRGIIPSAICLGIAGVDRADDVAVIRAVLRRVGYKARTLVVNDALVALVAGAHDAPGIVIIAGTGSIAYGRNAAGYAARAGGWGYVLGDEGSGYWIGRLALRAVVREADRRGRPTTLTGHILRHFGVARPQDLVHVIYHQNLRPVAIAGLAACVQQAFDEGDDTARQILRAGADELIRSAASVMARLQMEQDEFTFVLAGGIFQAIPWLAGELRERLPQQASRCAVRLLDVEPAVGAVRLAIAEAQGGARVPAYL
jgi:N-acetylglucosamine kinase-like BadF-type ATPase